LRSRLVGEEAHPARESLRAAARARAPAKGRGRDGADLEVARRSRGQGSPRRPERRDLQGERANLRGAGEPARRRGRRRDRGGVAAAPAVAPDQRTIRSLKARARSRETWSSVRGPSLSFTIKRPPSPGRT